MGTSFQPLQSQPNNQDNCKDELPCDHPAGHRLLGVESDEGPEGRLAFCQPWLPVRIPHLCRLAWTGAGQLPLGRLNGSSVVLHRPPSSCQDLSHSARFPNNPWSYEACSTPPEHSGAHHPHQPAYTAPVHQHPTYTVPVQHVPVYHVPVQHAPAHHAPAYTFPVHQPNHIHSAYTGALQDAGPFAFKNAASG